MSSYKHDNKLGESPGYSRPLSAVNWGFMQKHGMQKTRKGTVIFQERVLMAMTTENIVPTG